MFDAYSFSASQVALWGVAYFAGLYFGMALLNIAVVTILKRLHIGRVLDTRPLAKGQIRRELQYAFSSIVIFGVGLLLPWLMLRATWATVRTDRAIWLIGLEILVLLLWNEVHFYLHHRVLHHRWMFPRFHVQHHRSYVTTPFSTYAFHPVEALLLGSVPLLPMLLHAFSWQALVALPILSMLFNSVGHANYDAFPQRGGRGVLLASRRHHLHHAYFKGNFGFLLGFMDAYFNTALADTPPQAHTVGPDRAA